LPISAIGNRQSAIGNGKWEIAMANTTEPTHAATAYAQSLLELGDERQITAELAAELAGVRQAFAEVPELRQVLADPSIKDAEKRRLLDAFTSQASGLTVGFLELLASRGDLGMLPEIVDAYQRLLDRRQGKADVEVTVAKPLGQAELDLVRQRVSTAIRKEAVIQQQVDESILGGIIIKVGDRLIDGSVRAQLADIRRRMLAPTK